MRRTLSCRQVVASIDDEATGPSYSVTALSAGLQRLGIESSLLTVGRCRQSDRVHVFSQDYVGVPLLNRLSMSSGLARTLDELARCGTLLHSHGLWLMPNLYPAWSARRYKNTLVVSPRGMLGPEALEYSTLKKKVMWNLAQRRALANAQCFHATSEAECADIRRAGLDSPVAVIPNGIDVPEGEANPQKTILALGRLHPKKGIDQLIGAWARVAERHPDWCLRIVGPSEVGCRQALEAQVDELAVPRVRFDEPLYGSEKWKAYREAGLFVLPTRNENFGMVVAEALAAGVPVISTKGAPWGRLETKRCGWWIDYGSEALAAALEDALTLPAETRAEMGDRGRVWMRQDFSWDEVAERMSEVYLWCLHGGPPPTTVVI